MEEAKHQIQINKQFIENLQGEVKDLQKRVTKIEMTKEKTDYQYEEIMKALDKLNNVTIPNLMNEIDELKNKPAKRYDQTITAIIGTIVGAVGGAIVSLILK